MAVGFVETDSGGISPVWASLDGVAWAVSLEVTGEAREILLVEASGQQIIGLSDGAQSYGFDGQTWIEVDGPLKGQLVTIAGFGGTFIAIGTGRNPVIWAIGP